LADASTLRVVQTAHKFILSLIITLTRLETCKRTPFVLNGSFELFGLDSSSKRAPGRCDAVGGL